MALLLSGNADSCHLQIYSLTRSRLVATLGPKSALKKVNRKQILNVNVAKACQTIIIPEAPMALRLTSNLLSVTRFPDHARAKLTSCSYGVSRVYQQQCGYVLVDAQTMQSNMRTLLRVVRTADLDTKAPRAR